MAQLFTNTSQVADEDKTKRMNCMSCQEGITGTCIFPASRPQSHSSSNWMGNKACDWLCLHSLGCDYESDLAALHLTCLSWGEIFSEWHPYFALYWLRETVVFIDEAACEPPLWLSWLYNASTHPTLHDSSKWPTTDGKLASLPRASVVKSVEKCPLVNVESPRHSLIELTNWKHVKVLYP